jgi:glycine/D-amino acid oxidase-like deaminating enzyme
MAHSLWKNSSFKTGNTRYPRLEGTRTVDVAIVGAGITGVTAAYILRKEGKRVALLDQSNVLDGETALTTAHFTEDLDTPF